MNEPEFPSRDPLDVIVELQAIERRLVDLERESHEANAEYRERKIGLIQAEAAVKACHTEFEIKKQRAMILQSALRALPR